MKMPRSIKPILLKAPHEMLLTGYLASSQIPHISQKIWTASKLGLPRDGLTRLTPTSDDLFILGSGWSINNLTDEQLHSIASADSFGFNFWSLHPLRPSAYFMEAMDLTYRAPLSAIAADNLINAMISRPDYREIPRFISDLTSDRRPFFNMIPKEWLPGLSSLITTGIFARSRSEVADSLRLLKHLGFFNQSKVLLKYRATAVMLVLIGYLQGYKRIILCGFDITDPRYFFHDTSRYGERGAFLKVSSNTHPTGQRREMMATIQEIMFAIDDNLLRPAGVELAVADSSSGFHPGISQFDWNTAA